MFITDFRNMFFKGEGWMSKFSRFWGTIAMLDGGHRATRPHRGTKNPGEKTLSGPMGR